MECVNSQLCCVMMTKQILKFDMCTQWRRQGGASGAFAPPFIYFAPVRTLII